MSAVTPRRRSRVHSNLLTAVIAVMAIYSILPIVYLLISATKTDPDFFSTFGLGFGESFALFQNIAEVFTYQDGVFGRWFLNSLIYVVVGGGGSAIIATLAGYGIAKYAFRGRRAVFGVIIGVIAIPGTALALPTFLLFSAAGLTDNPLAVIIPTLVNPFGLYLMWVYASEAIPSELLEAGRIDGAGELRMFGAVSFRLLGPGFVTVLLFSIVATWNNYFLPLLMLSDSQWFPLTVGLGQWSTIAAGAGAQPIQHLILTGSLLTIIPLAAAFLGLQRYWQSGLSAGSVKQ